MEITKEIKEAILDVAKSRADYGNYGMFSTYRCKPDSHAILFRHRIRIKDTTVTMGDTVIAKIHRRYAARKVNGNHKELVPTIDYNVA